MWYSTKMRSTISTDGQAIEALLSRGVEDVFIKENIKTKLLSGDKLRIKLGFDPTGSKIHIGRAIVLRKLRDFQKLGHTVVFIVGDFTARIGDPSDKLEKRPMLSTKEIKENLKTYKAQIGKIIDLKKAEFHFNSKWLSKLGFTEIAELAESFSVQQMTARRNFKERIDTGEEISLREFLYPLMQGYDSVAVKADIELGGFDQLFNLKAGRTIQKHYGQPQQDVVTFQMLEGTDGRKMSTSWGNIITIVDEPNDMYGKIMSLKDELMEKYFLLCTDVSETEIKNILATISNGGNPKDAKMRLAREIVTLYHGEKNAVDAEHFFVHTFQKKEIPETIEEVIVAQGQNVAEILVQKGLCSSKSDFRRLLEGNSITNLETNMKITSLGMFNQTGSYRIGPKRFIKIIFQ